MTANCLSNSAISFWTSTCYGLHVC